MKKFNLLTILFAMFALGFLASCGTDDPSEELPILTTNPSSDLSAVAGTLVSFSVTAGENPSSKSELETLVIDANGVNEDTTITFANNTTTFQGTFTFTAPAAGSTNIITFTLTDKAGKSNVESITITGTSGANPILTWSATLLGGQTNPTIGSAFASTNGQVYLKAAAATNSSLIDFVYFYGASNLATLAAPDDDLVDGTAANSVDLTDTYTTKNATRFMTTTVTPAEFTAMTDDADFPAFTGSSSLENNLAVGDVIAFETVAGKVGLIHVSALSTGATGTLTIDVKVQQ
ncbi:MAG: hypothetical protein KDD29_08595 [Flavobacteriales bacterium]|nr:hypothetical protein [Flavobacteriales bacterium]MCB9256133.1 hypothetical protein [Chitinophagales bacterium]